MPRNRNLVLLYQLFWLALGLGVLSSCYGPRRVVLVNQTDEPLTVAWGLRPTQNPARPYASTQIDTLFTFMDEAGKARKTGLVFGRGKWNVNEFDRVSQRLAFVEVIDSGKVVYRLSGRDSVRQMLSEHVKGLNKRVVEIDVP